ncbi:MAG: response regulator [Desulfohalobiaceae bacterium]|nr:response regulator [Desulfohalobiaceae bacterium]
MTMPKMSGDKLASAIKHICGDVPVILCTGFSEQIKGRQEELDSDGLLMKPVDKSDLLRTVRDVLDEAKGNISE